LSTKQGSVDGQTWLHGLCDVTLLQEVQSRQGKHQANGTAPHAVEVFPEENVFKAIEGKLTLKAGNFGGKKNKAMQFSEAS
jgi:hypothetical protein